MNIFLLESVNGTPCPFASAYSQCDKHVVKMPLETAQIVSTVVRQHGYEEGFYKATHKNHPCTVWAGASRNNFNWLLNHGLALCEEYTERYGKIHASQQIIELAVGLKLHWKSNELTPFAQCMPEQFKCSDPVAAYRAYYLVEKKEIATWRRNQPTWWE